MTPELHRPIRTDRIGPEGLTVEIEATQEECARLTARMHIPAVQALRVRFQLTREPDDRFAASGWLVARVVQTCVVSLEDFEASVEEAFRIRFVPEGTEQEDPDPDSDDELPYAGSVIDLGEAAAEQLALALDPYPRRPDAVLPEAAGEDAANPFAALAALRRKD
ncbi:MAG: DUF177 domain-containing protein [Rhodospirillales bacterium]|nr:DUF177 domain-containing protein [Rhodospirillales bacterium]